MLSELVKIAEQYIGVKELGENSGPEVEKFQMAVDGKASGESWCMAFVQYCILELEQKTNKRSNIFHSEHCLTTWNKSPIELRRTSPEPGYIVIWKHGQTANGHTGIVSKVIGSVKFESIEGNTSDSACVNRNGDGVYRKIRNIDPAGEMKIIGFLVPFEEN
jgi:hypothetical protein